MFVVLIHDMIIDS